jgi:hypothetical protein
MVFLQLGRVGGHKSVVKASWFVRMTKEERPLARTSSSLLIDDIIDDAMHRIPLKTG